VTDLTTDRTTERWPAGLSSEPPDRHEREPDDRSSTSSDGVTLTRLLALARLTPPQALEIGASVLAEAARRSELDAGSSGGDQVTVDQVVLCPDGRVVLAAADGRRGHRPPASGLTRAAAETVLADLAGAARLAGRRADPAAEQLLAELDQAVTELPVAGVPVVAGMLREAAAVIDRTAVRAELAALVRAAGGDAGPARGSGPAGAPSTAVGAAPAGPAISGGSRVARRRIGAWLLSLLVLAGVVLLEVAFLRDKIAGDIGLLLDAGRGGSAPFAAPAPDGLPIVPPAPAAAGGVHGIDLRALAQCTPGAPCALRLLVRLDPGADPQVVTWSYVITDRCTGATVTAPGGTVTVPVQGERAAAVGTVALPAAKAVAVVAVTDAPAAAASPPVLLGSCTADPQVN
jgi:hypothetical protein